MKLIIPMAGRGTRLRPHTHTIQKPLLPVAGTSVVERIINTFHRTLDRTIDEIVFVLGEFDDELQEQLNELCSRHEAKSTFRKQDQALGTAHAVYSASDDLEGEVIIVFADTIFDTQGTVSVEDADSVIWLKKVDDPTRFGVAIHEGDTITDFVEKPEEPVSDLAIIGVYYFKEGAELRKQLKYLIDNDIRGKDGEYQLTDALDRCLKEGKLFKTATVDEWLDAGTLQAWLDTTAIILDKENDSNQVDPQAFPTSRIIPPVHIEDGVEIEGSVIGPYTSLAAGTKVTDSVIKESIVLKNSEITNSTLHRATVGNHAYLDECKGSVHLGDHSVVKPVSNKT